MPAGATYYPNTYIVPEKLNKYLAESTENFEQIHADYLSQRFLLKLPDNSSSYAMTFRLSGRHAMRVYVNGKLTEQTGELGGTKEDTELWDNNISFYGAAVDGEMEIILHSAQFYHAKRGASLGELSLSKSETITNPFFFVRMKGIAVMGALLCAAVLLFAIYLILSPTRATMYFASSCVVIALRECLQSHAWIFFHIPGNLSFMLEYLTVVLMTIFLSLYLGQYVSGRFLSIIQYTAIIGSCLYGAFVLLGDSIFYTSVLKYYQLLLVLCIVPGIAVLFYKMRNPITEQAIAMYGIGVFFLAALSDILMYSDVLGNQTNKPISETAMIVFVIAQTVSLFKMNNRVLVEVKEAEHKLEAEKIALENLNRMKTEFLGNVSHELKTPITVMSGYAQTTKQLVEKADSLDAGEISHRMSLISSEAERLSLMVGQVLDVTCIEEGRMLMERVPCNIDEIIHAAIETHYPILNKNRNRLNIRLESGISSVYADPMRISQVIVNLISNALSFTKDGLIKISASTVNDKILICVADTGVGISSEQLPHVFERYSREEKHGGSQLMGTGLGLYICKHIVEQHGGEIWIESEKGRGSSVFFNLPLYKGK